jgi:photosystem II stability/assembly factor-like uncharacterized protein
MVGKRSENGGALWHDWQQQPCTDKNGFIALTADPDKSKFLYLRCEQGLLRSRDGGDHWQRLSLSPGLLLAAEYGKNARLLWVQDDGSLWASRDNGDSWQLVRGALGRPAFLPIVGNAPQP